MIKLNERLLEVAKMVPEGSNAIDVGCDHAFLAIYLKQKKICNKVVASDNKEGPLDIAKENIKKEKVDVQTSLADGVSKITKDINTVIVSGMGGGNIIGMFKYTPEKLKNVDTLVLSPNNDVPRLRREIYKLGFYIDDEVLVKYKNIIYNVIRFRKGKSRISIKESIYGPVLIKKKDKLFKEYIENDIRNKKLLLEILPKNYILKRLELKRDIKISEQVIK